MDAARGAWASSAQWLSVASAKGLTTLQSLDDFLTSWRCKGLWDALFSSETAKQTIIKNRRTQPPECQPLAKEFSRRGVMIATLGGALLGYAIAKWVEPRVRSASARAVLATRVRLRAARVALDRRLSRLFKRFGKRRPSSSKGGLPSPKTTTTKPQQLTSTRRAQSARFSSSSRSSSFTSVGSISEHVDVRDEVGAAVDASTLRQKLDDGDLLSFAYDGATYQTTNFATLTRKARPTSKRRLMDGRVVEDCSAALAHCTIFDEDQSAFKKAADSYVDVTQRTRFLLALRLLQQNSTGSCVAVVRLVRRPSELSEPPRAGDVVVVWSPKQHDPTRSLVDRKATTPIVVNQLVDALTVNRVLAPYTIRVEASSAQDDDLHYDLVYKKLFQLPLLR